MERDARSHGVVARSHGVVAESLDPDVDREVVETVVTTVEKGGVPLVGQGHGAISKKPPY